MVDVPIQAQVERAEDGGEIEDWGKPRMSPGARSSQPATHSQSYQILDCPGPRLRR